jgi:hypothetical protein
LPPLPRTVISRCCKSMSLCRGVVPQAGQLGQPDTGRFEHRDDRGIAALGEAAARTGMFQPGQLLAGEDRDQLVGDARRLQPGHRVGQLAFGGQPLECPGVQLLRLLPGTSFLYGRGSEPGHHAWLNPGRPRTTDGPERHGLCAAVEVPARAHSRLTPLPHSLTVPVCALRPEQRVGRRCPDARFDSRPPDGRFTAHAELSAWRVRVVVARVSARVAHFCDTADEGWDFD